MLRINSYPYSRQDSLYNAYMYQFANQNVSNNAPMQYGYYNFQNSTPSFKGRLATQPDTVTFCASNQLQPKKEGMSTGAKWAIGTVAVVGLGALAYILGKGRCKPQISNEAMNKLNNLVSNGKIEKNYLDVFTDTNGYEGKEFVQKAYDKLVNLMGYNKHKPSLNIVDKSASSKSGSNVIKISIEGFPTKEQQIGAIRHELEHFRQHELVYRSFGKEAYVNARIEPSLTVLKLNDEKCIEKLGKTYKELTASEIEAYKAKVRTSVESKLQILEDLLQERGSISSTSSEYAEAKKYLQAMKEYISPIAVFGDKAGTFTKMKTEAPDKYKLAQELTKQYQNNVLEQGASKEESKIKNMYKLFEEALS